MTCRSMDEEKEMERFGDNDVWIYGMEDHDYVDTDWDSHSQSLTGCTAYEEETDMAFNTEETYGQGLIV